MLHSKTLFAHFLLLIFFTFFSLSTKNRCLVGWILYDVRETKHNKCVDKSSILAKFQYDLCQVRPIFQKFRPFNMVLLLSRYRSIFHTKKPFILCFFHFGRSPLRPNRCLHYSKWQKSFNPIFCCCCFHSLVSSFHAQAPIQSIASRNYTKNILFDSLSFQLLGSAFHFSFQTYTQNSHFIQLHGTHKNVLKPNKIL